MALTVAAILCALFTVSNADVLPLSVVDNQVLIGGAKGSLPGMSFFWTNDGWGQEKFYNRNVVKWLKEDWKVRIIRAAMGIEEYGGYLEDPENNKARLRTVVDAAIEFDIYAIIDLLDHYARLHITAAIAFFEEMARIYVGKNNVIYELFNEPRDDVSWRDNVKPYAEAVIRAIRATDSTNLILVGSPHWDQDVDVVAADKITSYGNIAYTLHFYAGVDGHRQELKDKAIAALNNHTPLFVSEWGTVANCNGAVNVEENNIWIDFMKANYLSNCNWSVSDKTEACSALKPGASADGGWSESQLSESGKFVREMIRNWSN